MRGRVAKGLHTFFELGNRLLLQSVRLPFALGLEEDRERIRPAQMLHICARRSEQLNVPDSGSIYHTVLYPSAGRDMRSYLPSVCHPGREVVKSRFSRRAFPSSGPLFWLWRRFIFSISRRLDIGAFPLRRTRVLVRVGGERTERRETVDANASFGRCDAHAATSLSYLFCSGIYGGSDPRTPPESHGRDLSQAEYDGRCGRIHVASVQAGVTGRHSSPTRSSRHKPSGKAGRDHGPLPPTGHHLGHPQRSQNLQNVWHGTSPTYGRPNGYVG